MSEEYNRPVSRDDLIFTVRMALEKESSLWPRKKLPGDFDRFKPMAMAIVDQIELSGVRCFRRPPRPPIVLAQGTVAFRRQVNAHPLLQ